jgi:hypothetical protein
MKILFVYMLELEESEKSLGKEIVKTLKRLLTETEIMVATNCQQVLEKIRSLKPYDLIIFETLDLPLNSNQSSKKNTLKFIQNNYQIFENYIGKIIIWNNSEKIKKNISDMKLTELKLFLLQRPICEENLLEELKKLLNK